MTPPGVAAIAVVRIVGPATGEFLRTHFSGTPRASRPVHGLLRDDAGEQIDDPVVVIADDGRFADINLHGGAWVVRAVLDLAKLAGFECIERAMMPMIDDAIDAADVIDREIEAYLPLAVTELALRTLLAQAQAWKGLLARADTISRGEIDAILGRSLAPLAPASAAGGDRRRAQCRQVHAGQSPLRPGAIDHRRSAGDDPRLGRRDRKPRRAGGSARRHARYPRHPRPNRTRGHLAQWRSSDSNADRVALVSMRPGPLLRQSRRR